MCNVCVCVCVCVFAAWMIYLLSCVGIVGSAGNTVVL